jgi:hypothetical protein
MDCDCHSADLRQVLIDSRRHLCAIWDRRSSDTDFIMLFDLRHELSERRLLGWYTKESIEAARREAASHGRAPFLPFLQPRAVLNDIAASSLDLGKSASLLKRTAEMHPGLVPVWAVYRCGCYVTACWAPPGQPERN